MKCKQLHFTLINFAYLQIFAQYFPKMVIKESPAAKRNRVPIGEALKKHLGHGNTSKLLEIASGN